MKQDNQCINAIRVLASETITNANSGHPGGSFSSAPILYALMKDHMVYSESDGLYVNRDRFVLSAGHLSALWYTMQHFFGSVTIDELKSFRQFGSTTPGHPEIEFNPGTDASTGPLGQGVANAVGLAIASSMLAQRFNVLDDPIITNYTYVLCGDGCLMEGVAQEAISLAGTLKLNKLILLYDYNKITIDGNLDGTNTEDVSKKFSSMGWNVLYVSNGSDSKQISNAIKRAKESLEKPTAVIIRTVIADGSPLAGSEKTHGKPFSKEDNIGLRKQWGLAGDEFTVPEEVYKVCNAVKERNLAIEIEWRKKLVLYSKTNPELFRKMFDYTDEKEHDIEKIIGNKIKDKKLSGRAANAKILNLLAEKIPSLVGGTADLAASTLAKIDDGEIYSATCRRGRNILFGIREHAMAAICNGIRLYAKFKVFCSTFFTFSNYLIPALRMSALMKQQIFYFFSHDSILVGEDGPTHQPVEQISTLRSMPGIQVFRPADTTELIGCYANAINAEKPSVFILSRQDLNDQPTSVEGAKKGGYILEASTQKADLVLFATGSELDLAVALKKELAKQNLNASVVSMPSVELFEQQSEDYKASVLQRDIPFRVSIEASNDYIWYKYIGSNGLRIGVTEFGHSGKPNDVYKSFGFTVPAIKKEILTKFKLS